MEVEDKKEEEGGGRSEEEEEEEAEATVAEATGTGKGGGTGIGWGTTGFVAFAAGIVGGGGGGGGDPTWTAEVVAAAASYSCTSETVGTRPCGFRFFFFFIQGWDGLEGRVYRSGGEGGEWMNETTKVEAKKEY